MVRGKYRGYDYDAIVIGSGIGGLTAAACLAKQGIKVLICEQHNRPGGYFTSFKHKGYIFDGGIQACENLGALIPMLQYLGILDRINLKRSPVGMALPDTLIKINSISDIDKFYEALGRKFPSQVEGLKRISEDTQILANVLDAYVQLPNPVFDSYARSLAALPGWLIKYRKSVKHSRMFGRLMKLPMEEYIAEHVNDQNLMRVLQHVFPRGTPASFGLGYTKLFIDYYYPDGGMQVIADAIAGSIKENGGQMMLKTLVEEVILKNDRADGVKVQGGEIIRAPFVISNGDAKRLILKMVPPGSLPDSYRERMERTEVCESAFRLFLGVDIPPEDLPLKGCEHIFPFCPDYQGVTYEEMRNAGDFFRRSPQVISIPCMNHPGMAPEGKSGIMINVATIAEWGKNWGTRNGERTPEYQDLKEKVTEDTIAVTEKIIPGIAKKIEVKIPATPYTLERYTLNTGGTVMGWTYNPRETFHNTGRNYLALGHFTPIKNLLQVGHWAFYPGGAPSGIFGGKIVADYIKTRLKLGL
ncbi:MAG: NAD(P)/FAD-dependent oxidoreductase [Deltaproteobacteria bacterium]|nr:MAG: NAD(P)/FAD-dependent oxidoreductase [Deltaproteobacteria bacterium]